MTNIIKGIQQSNQILFFYRLMTMTAFASDSLRQENKNSTRGVVIVSGIEFRKIRMNGIFRRFISKLSVENPDRWTV